MQKILFMIVSANEWNEIEKKIKEDGGGGGLDFSVKNFLELFYAADAREKKIHVIWSVAPVLICWLDYEKTHAFKVRFLINSRNVTKVQREEKENDRSNQTIWTRTEGML